MMVVRAQQGHGSQVGGAHGFPLDEVMGVASGSCAIAVLPDAATITQRHGHALVVVGMTRCPPEIEAALIGVEQP